MRICGCAPADNIIHFEARPRILISDLRSVDVFRPAVTVVNLLRKIDYAVARRPLLQKNSTRNRDPDFLLVLC